MFATTFTKGGIGFKFRVYESHGYVKIKKKWMLIFVLKVDKETKIQLFCIQGSINKLN